MARSVKRGVGNRTYVASRRVAADGSTIPRDGIPNLAYSNTSNRITTAGWQYDSAGNQIRALAEDGVTWLNFEYDAASRIRVVKRDDAGQTMLQAFQYGSTNARLMDYDAVAGLNKLFASTGGTVLAEYTEFRQTGLDYAVNRTYDSKQGRFTQVDPIGMKAWAPCRHKKRGGMTSCVTVTS